MENKKGPVKHFCVIIMTYGRVRQCMITPAYSQSSLQQALMLTVGHRQRSKHITSSSHDIAAFRHWAFSVCFTALREQHKEETSIRKESGGEEANKENSRFYYADLIHKSSWLLSLEIQKKKKGNRNRTNKERCWNAKLKSGFSLFLTVEGNDLPLAQSKSPVVPTGVWATWIESRLQQIWPILQHVTARAKPVCLYCSRRRSIRVRDATAAALFYPDDRLFELLSRHWEFDASNWRQPKLSDQLQTYLK